MLTSEDLQASGSIVEEKVDELAETLDKGFSGMEKRFGKRFDGVEGRLTTVETRLGSVETKLENIKQKIDRTYRKVNVSVSALVIYQDGYFAAFSWQNRLFISC